MQACFAGSLAIGEAKEGFMTLTPVRPVAQLPEVRQRLFWTSGDTLDLGQLVAEGDEEFAVPFALVGREGEDASDVVA
jgi:hypothetical protein